MKQDLQRLTSKYRGKGILIDTNLLLLYLIGSLDDKLIENFKRTKAYVKEDYEILKAFIGQFENIIATPNILTEVNNLANSLPDHYKSAFHKILGNAIEIIDEKYIQSKKISRLEEFFRFGITDSGIMELIVEAGNQTCLLLTDDFRLSQYFSSKKGDVVNFNHIRTLAW